MSTVYPPDGTSPETSRPPSGPTPFPMPPVRPEGAPDRRHILFGYIDEDIREFPENCAVVAGDVNRLSDINAFQGHHAGDAFLERMREAFGAILIGETRGAAPATDTGERRRRTDEVTDDRPKIPFRARFVHINGDEIGIAIVGIDNLEDLKAYMERMVTRLRDEYNISISMGGAIHQEGQTSRQLYATAFGKEEESKHQGRVVAHAGLPAYVKGALTTLHTYGEANGMTIRTLAGLGEAAAKEKRRRAAAMEAEKRQRAARVVRKTKIVPVPSSSNPQ